MRVKSILLLILLTCAAALSERGDAALAPALFIFGDSTVDTGNQNYITSVVKSNYPPYGRDFVPPGPTGRFSNGKLANDFVAEYLGLPFPVNFLSPAATGSAILTGVNLASSGSGYLDITGQLIGVVNLSKQLDNFGVVQARIVQQLGQSGAFDLIRNSTYLISTGSNDFVNNYNINPILQEQYNPQQYQQLVLNSITKNLQTLYGYGARKVLIVSLGPVGCIPEQVSLLGSEDGECVEDVNAPLRNFNQGLKLLVTQLRSENLDYQLLYVNIYDFLLDFVENPASHGYQFGTTACCGEGPYNGLPCVDLVSDVCADADDYVFWDFFHPSQTTYEVLAKNIISGNTSLISPDNLQGIL